jgi:hypothetical protein
MDITYKFIFKMPRCKMEVTATKRRLKSLVGTLGFYNYDKSMACINLSEFLYPVLPEDMILRRIYETINHETFHHAIFEITGIKANKWEEKLVDKITEEKL